MSLKFYPSSVFQERNRLQIYLIIFIICFSIRLKNVSICIISAKMLFFVDDSKRQMGMATSNYPKMQPFCRNRKFCLFNSCFFVND